MLRRISRRQWISPSSKRISGVLNPVILWRSQTLLRRQKDEFYNTKKENIKKADKKPGRTVCFIRMRWSLERLRKRKSRRQKINNCCQCWWNKRVWEGEPPDTDNQDLDGQRAAMLSKRSMCKHERLFFKEHDLPSVPIPILLSIKKSIFWRNIREELILIFRWSQVWGLRYSQLNHSNSDHSKDPPLDVFPGTLSKVFVCFIIQHILLCSLNWRCLSN